MGLLQNIFISVVNMSITASYVILFTLLIRLALKKAPKVFSYTLWIVVLFRLVCPVSFPSALSLIRIFNESPVKIEYPAINTGITTLQQINTTSSETDSLINSLLPAATPYASADPMQIILFVGSVIWAFGIISILLYSVISFLLLKRRVRFAVPVMENIFECEGIASPFVFGIVKPKIYLPVGLSYAERSYILAHERTHIRRFDYLIKPAAFLTLCIHWFNPLVWVSFVFMAKDMEMSCDERVLKELGPDIKKEYSTSLLKLAYGGKIAASPLAFGESNTKARIRNILNYKKPSFWVMIAALIVITGAVIGLTTNPTVQINRNAVGTPATSDSNENGSNTDSTAPVNSNQVAAEEPASTNTLLEPAMPAWTLDQTIGADMASLDYVSEDMVIFHGYFGLFVYDLKKLQLIRSLDLKPIECNFTQGDKYCEVSVSMDGNTIQLHPMSSDKMYVYSVADNKLEETGFQKQDNAFNRFVPINEAIGKEAGNYSYNAVKFDTGEYGYLHTYDWTLGTLSYKRGDMMYALFRTK